MNEKEVKIRVAADVDDDQVKALEKLLNDIGDKVIGFEVSVEDGELDTAKDKEEDLNTTAEVDIEVDDSAVQLAMQNIKEGFSSIKQSASEMGAVLADSLESAGKQETNRTFLEQALGDPDEAKAKLGEINEIVQALPGDDSVMQGLLGQAVAKDASLTTAELTKMGNAASDYFAAMKNYGKSSSEAFQDMNNYLMTGNTAEIERSPILANHIDKLKEATTIQERSMLLQEALNEEHWGGISAQDTYNNKLETFNGMLERGQYNLGGMFQEGAKGLMDFALQLDDATNGLFGMGLAAASFASPLTDMVVGVGQMATGLNALKTAYEGTAIATAIAEGGFWSMAAAELAALWPILAIIAALALVAVAVYEVGIYFGWWTDVGSMIDAIWAGLLRLWSAFINHPDVQAIIGAIQSAWQALQPAIQSIIAWVGRFFSNSNGARFDAVRAFIDALGVAWQAVTLPLRTVISVLQQMWGVITTTMGYWNQASSKAKQVSSMIGSAFQGVKGKVESAFSGVSHAITAPFMNAYNTIKPIIDKIKWAYDTLGSLSGSAGIIPGSAGVTIGSAGISMGSVNGIGNANTNLMNTMSGSIGGTTNINLSGIIEESAGDFIVRKLNDELYKQNVLRGV